MRLFDLPQAKLFCTPAGAPAPGTEQSLRAFHATLGKTTQLTEGTPHFDIHRTNLLMSAERWLVFAVGHYRRAVEMLAPVTVPWANVTLYYASFFSANAMLAMFGAWVGHVDGPRAVDVEKAASGAQELKIHRRAYAMSPNGATGSHQLFWDLFYSSVPSLTVWAPPKLASALSPVNGDFRWQIQSRNAVNYDMFDAWQLSCHFHTTFRASRLKSLQGSLALQLDATEQLIRLALHFSKEVGLSSFGLDNCGFSGARTSIQRRLLKQAAPALLNQSAFSEFAA
jgi:hypothetical protein